MDINNDWNHKGWGAFDGRMKSILKKIMTVFLAILTGFGSIPVSAQENQIILTELEELAAPTEFPAKGIISMQVAKNFRIDSDGCYDIEYSKEYLPVVVDESKRVFAKLSVLADHLSMKVEEWGSGVTVSYHDTRIYLELNNTQAGYQNSLFYAYINMGQVPVVYEKEWFVPLDGFLQVTDCFAKYYETNEYGKKDLLIVPPQRTVLDDLSDFKKNLYKDYVFEYMKDLNYTEEDSKKIAGLSSVVCYLNGLLGFEMDSLLAFLTPVTEYGAEQTNFEYMDNYVDYMLSSDMERLTAILDSHDENMNILNVNDVLWDDNVGIGSLAGEEMIRSSAMSSNALSSYIDACNKIGGAVSTLGVGAKAGSSFVAVYQSLENVDAWNREGAELFLRYRNQISNKVLSDTLFDHAQKRIRMFSGNVSKEAYLQWLKENWLSVVIDSASLAEMKPLSLVGILSTAGTLSVELIGGDILDLAENFMTGAIGIQYQLEAVQVAEQCLKDYIGGNGSPYAGSSMSDGDLRKIMYHAMSACYTARYFGDLTVKKDQEEYRDLTERQKALNQKLTDMMGRIKNPGVPMGRVPKDFVSVNIPKLSHFENIVFNLCRIEGEIRSWEKEEPLKNVKIEVVGENGKTLAEFETDEDGWFDAAFELNEADPYDAAPLKRVLTLHLNYKRNPEILERIEVSSFKKYNIEGLHAGKKVEQLKAYLCGAKDESGRTVLDIRRVILHEDTVYFDMPDWQEGTFETYTVLPGQMELGSEMERIMLEDDTTFETVYTQMMPEGSFVGGMARLLSQMEEGILPDALLKTQLHDAEDIQAFVDTYVEINGEYPAFEIEKVNSMVEHMEPIMILTTE